MEHEILPVTNGYRVTLTYNLYHCDQLNPVPSLNVTTTPFYQNLKAALGQPHFLREGGVLGFACQHSYVFKEFGESKDPKIRLKGSDRMVMLAATSLELKVAVTSIVKTEKDWYGDSLFHCGFYYKVTDDLIDKGNGYSWKQYFKDCRHKSAENIMWCQKLKEKVPAISAITYGNEYSPETCYMAAAAILVNVPKWSEKSPLHDSIEDYVNEEITHNKAGTWLGSVPEEGAEVDCHDDKRNTSASRGGRHLFIPSIDVVIKKKKLDDYDSDSGESVYEHNVI